MAHHVKTCADLVRAITRDHIFDGLSHFWRGVPPPQKAAMLVLCAVVLAGHLLHQDRRLFPFVRWGMYDTRYEPETMVAFEMYGITRTGERTVLGEIWKILADEKSNGRVHGAESLYKIAEIGDGKLMRSAMAQDDNLKLKLMAAAALGRCGNRPRPGPARRRTVSNLRHLDRKGRAVGRGNHRPGPGGARETNSQEEALVRSRDEPRRG